MNWRRLGCPSDETQERERGAALVEFAVILVLLCVVVLGTIDFGRVFYTAMALSNSVRAGAQYGSQSVTKSSDTTGMTTAALNSGSADLGASALWFRSAARRCECDGAVITCSATCAGTNRIYVTVTAWKLFSLISGFPGLPNSLSIQRSATLRAQ